MNDTKKKIDLKNEIERLTLELEKTDPKSPEYQIIANNLDLLICMRNNKPMRISTDTIVVAATNILGILLILNYENLHVVSSKAIGFILKGRL